MNLRETALEILYDSLQAVSPGSLIRASLKLELDRLRVQHAVYPLRGGRGIHVFGSGKAAVESARVVEGLLGDRIAGGLVISGYGESSKGKIKIVQGSHPVPTLKSVKAADLLLHGLAGLRENDFFIYLLSGGSSSLLEKPLPPVTLRDLQKTVRLLLENAVPIEEMNVVRKHLSLVKGGRLCEATRARGAVLVVSDVIGDRLDTIGSAPLFYDQSTYSDAREILSRHGIWKALPAPVKSLISRGIMGTVPETPKKENDRVRHHIIGNNLILLKRAKTKAQALGIPARIMSSRLRGEAREAARAIFSIGEEVLFSHQPFTPPVCMIFGGETTVTVRGKGKGGRNQEMCLAVLRELGDRENIVFLSAGSDGIDGNSEAAGAVVDCKSSEKARSLGLVIEDYLERSDSSSFLRRTGDLIVTGPTGTNVMDIVMLLIGEGDL